MLYEKPALPISDQIELLKSRGLIVENYQRAEHYLSNIGYYRLSAYMLPYKQIGVDKFREDITFETILDTYIFDRELRLLVFDAIERIEIAFRTQTIYQPSIAKGAYWFENKNNYFSEASADDSLAIIDEQVLRSKEVFIEHLKPNIHLNNDPQHG